MTSCLPGGSVSVGPNETLRVFFSPYWLGGDRLGPYKAMSDGAKVTPAELATRTGTDERYVREWLSAQAANGYAEYDAASETF